MRFSVLLLSHLFSIYGMPVLFSSMLDRFPRSKVLSLFSCCSGYHLPCDLVQRLSTPDPGIENTEDPSAMECTLIEEILKDPKKRKEIPDITTTTTEQAIQKLAKGKAPDHMSL
jgi:hypothetical protein